MFRDSNPQPCCTDCESDKTWGPQNCSHCHDKSLRLEGVDNKVTNALRGLAYEHLQVFVGLVQRHVRKISSTTGIFLETDACYSLHLP